MALDDDSVSAKGAAPQTLQSASEYAQAPTSNGCTEFHKFPKLPAELRLEIWDQAHQSAPAPSKVYRFRVDIITLTDADVACFTPFKEVADLTRQQRNLLRINAESRYRVLERKYVDVFLPFNYVDGATNKVVSGSFPYFDLNTVFYLDVDGEVAKRLFPKRIFGRPVQGTSLFSQIRVLGAGFQFEHEPVDHSLLAATPIVIDALLYAYRYAFKNIQRLALVSKLLHSQQCLQGLFRCDIVYAKADWELDIMYGSTRLRAPRSFEFSCWHDWAGLVSDSHLDFSAFPGSDEDYPWEFSRYKTSVMPLAMGPNIVKMQSLPDRLEEYLEERLELHPSQHGSKAEAELKPIMIILPTAEDMSDWFDRMQRNT